MAKVDLHIHSTASDGTRSPRELVAMASEKSLSLMSITDHDTLDGIPEGVDVAVELEIELIPGIELSVDLEERGLTAHLLGYFPGVDIPFLVNGSHSLGKAIAYVQGGRSRRNPRILEKLADNSIYIEMETVQLIAGGDVIGRPHIAEAMINAGYVGSTNEAFSRFLAKGKPAYVERDRLSVFRAIEIIVESGGLPVMAHPGYIEMDSETLRGLFERMKGYGLAGIEVYYPSHTASMITTLLSFARELQLVITGGTDYHGRSNEPHPLGGTEEGFHIEQEDIKDFIILCRDHSRR
ncbi:MAG: PHP domain-containing protein [Candidatus Aegiribacteria sp.]|nr:PHP domain-containing protein [Candidatus Aegiribacteria sp.]